MFPKQEIANFCLFFIIVPMLLTAACWSSIPPGYNVNHEQTIYTFPKYLEYTHSTVRQFPFRWEIFRWEQGQAWTRFVY